MCPHYPYSDIKDPVYGHCKKCNDYFRSSMGGQSANASCRIHNFDEFNYCLDCYAHKNNCGNCYHIKKSWWRRFFCF